MAQDAHEALVEKAAKAFCEASGLYKWGATYGNTRKWYLDGARAAVDLIAGETKTATAEMIKSFHNNTIVGRRCFGDPRARNVWTTMHSRSALYPKPPEEK